MFHWIANWLWRRRVAREWRIVERWFNDMLFEGRKIGETWIVGELNGLGHKRVRVSDKGGSYDVKRGGAWWAGQEWLTRIEPIQPSKLRVIK